MKEITEYDPFVDLPWLRNKEPYKDTVHKSGYFYNILTH